MEILYSSREQTVRVALDPRGVLASVLDRKSTRLNSSHSQISYAVFCLKKKKAPNSLTWSLPGVSWAYRIHVTRAHSYDVVTPFRHVAPTSSSCGVPPRHALRASDAVCP